MARAHAVSARAKARLGRSAEALAHLSAAQAAAERIGLGPGAPALVELGVAEREVRAAAGA